MTTVGDYSCEAFTMSGLEIVVVNGKGNVTVDDYGISKMIDPADEQDPITFYMETYDESGFLHFVNESATSMYMFSQRADWGDRKLLETEIMGSKYGPEDIQGDRFLIMQNTVFEADDWKGIPLEEVGMLKDEFVEIINAPENVCPGDTATFDVRVQGHCKVSNITGLQIDDLVNQESTSQGVNVGEGGPDVASGLAEFTETIEIDVPSDVAPQESMDIADISVNSRKGSGSKTVSIGIGNTPDALSLKETDDVSGVCPEDSISKTISVENTGSCSSTVQLQVANSFNDSVDEIDSITVQPGETQAGVAETTYRFEAPSGSLGESIQYEVVMFANGVEAGSTAFTVNVGDADISIDNVDSPNRVCPSEDIRMSIDVLNSASCDASAKGILTNSADDTVQSTATETVRGGSGRSYRFEDTIPSQAVGGIEYQFAVVDSDENELASTSFDIPIGSKDINLRNLDFDDSVCVGTEVDWSVEAQNGGDCDSDVTIGISDSESDQIDILETTNVRSDSSSSIRQSITIPPSEISKGSKQYTIHALVEEPDGLVTADTVSHSVSLNDSDISVVGTSFPDDVCIGREFNGIFTLSNSGVCEGQYRILATDSVSGNEIEVENTEIRGNSRDDASFTKTMPPGAIEAGELVYEYELQQLRPEGFTTIQTGTETVDVEDTDVNVTEVSSPNSACVGSTISPTIVLNNDSSCSSQYRVIVDKPSRPGTEVVDEDNIPRNTSINVSFDDTIPQGVVGSETIQYSAVVEVKEFSDDEYRPKDEVTFNVGILSSNLNISSVSSPSVKCIGTSASFEASISNTGDCSSEYRLRLDNITLADGETVKSGSLDPGNQVGSNFSDELGSGLSDEDIVQYELILDKRFNSNTEWQVADTRQLSIELNKPDVTITDSSYPEFDEPGEKQYEIVLSNNSECSTNIDISISGETKNKDISANSEINVVDEVTLLDDDISRDISVVDNVLEDEVETNMVTVTPHRYVSLDQDSRRIEIVGGFDEDVRYSGNIVATAISGSSDLEEEDRIAGAFGLKTFTGTMLSDSSDKDTINFGALKALSFQSQKSLSVISDGSLNGKSKTYSHSTLSASALNLDEGAAIQTVSGPMSNFGTLAGKVGLGSRILSPKFTRNR